MATPDNATTADNPTGDLVIERTIRLDLDAEALWALIADGDGWQRWIVDAADVDVREGGHGRVVDGDVAREVRVGVVDVGRSVTFTWWEHDDPATASEVRIALIGDGAGPTGLSITERIPAGVLARAASPSASIDVVRFAWEVRACVAWAAGLSTARV
jgi:uncharacterized protein YndB with AHSA1/START domain